MESKDLGVFPVWLDDHYTLCLLARNSFWATKLQDTWFGDNDVDSWSLLGWDSLRYPEDTDRFDSDCNYILHYLYNKYPSSSLFQTHKLQCFMMVVPKQTERDSCGWFVAAATKNISDNNWKFGSSWVKDDNIRSEKEAAAMDIKNFLNPQKVVTSASEPNSSSMEEAPSITPAPAAPEAFVLSDHEFEMEREEVGSPVSKQDALEQDFLEGSPGATSVLVCSTPSLCPCLFAHLCAHFHW